MKRILLSLFTLGSAVAMSQRPNIVLFLVDDMGWQDCSVPFHSDTTMWNRIYETPNMERLSAMGMKFTHAYAAPVSSPSRVSLITGVNATRHHVTNWTLQKDVSTDMNNDKLSFESWNVNGFSPEQGIDGAYHGTSFVQLLKDSGYLTLFVGKAHFGALTTPAEDPLNVGFEYNIAGHAAGGPASYLSETHYGESNKLFAVPGLEAYFDSGTFLTEALSLEALKLLDMADDDSRPFFLYMSHYAVHAPFDKDERYYDKYIDKGLEEVEARYAALVEGMDKSLGDLLDYLEKKGILDNTIVMFMSDNGGYSVGARHNTYGGISKSHPLRGGKGSLYEGGIREPMIIYAPGITTPGTINHSPIMIEDFFPTILELAGVDEVETIQALDSKSFVKALRGRYINGKRYMYWHYPNHWGERYGDCGAPGSAVIRGDMKFVHFYENGDNELYNLRTDIGECNNLIGKSKKYDRKAKRLAKKLSAKLRKEQSSMPIYKDTMKRVKYPDQYF